ncbi:MAG: hypothetical protein ACI38O_09345 [Fibrobacter intestinalis]|uniref:hypothetical protein n=1 Tax=Fibrobacter TaxID=832 RepID=UPI00130447C8|nr:MULTISPECIES: hypothetical protein [Fibrobacter]
MANGISFVTSCLFTSPIALAGAARRVRKRFREAFLNEGFADERREYKAKP